MFAVAPALRRSLEDYRAYEKEELIEDIAEMAKSLEGCRILHLSATPPRSRIFGTLDTLNSLLQSVGMVPEWRLVRCKPGQMIANMNLNMALNGHFVQWTPDMHENWLNGYPDLVQISFDDYDFIVVHDAEMAGMIKACTSVKRANKVKWIWHCHSDLSKVQPDVSDFLTLHAREYDARIMCSLAQSSPHSHVRFSKVPPTIDPLSLRNRCLPQEFVESVLREYGLDTQHPFVLHVLPKRPDFRAISRLVDGFCLANKRVPELQMLTVITGESDCQCSLNYAHYLNSKVGSPDHTRVAPIANGIGNMEINALQRSTIAVLEECADDEERATLLFETMWKGRPVIVGARSAALLGIRDGQNGYVARSAEDYGNKIVSLVESTLRATAIAQGAKEHVRDKFLITKLLYNYLATLHQLSSQAVTEIASTASMN